MELLLLSCSGIAIAKLRRSPLTGCLLAAALAGAWSGASEFQRREVACAGSLVTGELIAVTGIVANRVGTAGRSRRLLRIRRGAIRHHDRECQVDLVLARAPTATEVPPLGAHVRVEGEWMRFEDGGGLVTASRVETGAPVGGPSLLHLRHALSVRIDERLPDDVTPTGLALLLAERDEMAPGVRRRYAAAGMAHLLAVSGMHVGMLALGLMWCLGALSPPKRRILTLLALSGFVLLIGAPVAARRALVLLAGYFWASGRGWPSRTGELVGLAGLLILVGDPGSLQDAGFQLSFAGFSGIVVGARLCGPSHPFLLRVSVAGSCAFLATAPITAWHVGQVTPISLLSHFVAGPLVAASLPSLVATLVLPTPLWYPAAHVATGAIRLLDSFAGWFASVPLGHISVGPPGIGTWVAWLLLAWSARRFLQSGQWRAVVTPALLALPVLVAGPLLPLVRSQHALLCTLSVGQGDAAVLRTHGGRWMVFDGGPASRSWDAGSTIVLPFLRRHGAARVDLAVLSHPDLDHVGGLNGLLRNIGVDRVLDSGEPLPSAPYQRFLALVDDSGSRWLPARSGDSLELDGVKILILAPEGSAHEGPRTANETSVIFRVEFEGGFRYLNTGDATIGEEQGLLARWPGRTLQADLLKVGHHGSRTSSSTAFVEAVRPSLAVISSGARNSYGHPHAETIARLAAAGVPRVWRTDRHGSLCIEIDDGGLWRVRGQGEWLSPGTTP